MTIKEAKKKKRTVRTGKRAGMKESAAISIKLNDPDRLLVPLWELVKRENSRRSHETAAETASRVFSQGLTAELERLCLTADSYQVTADPMDRNLF